MILPPQHFKSIRTMPADEVLQRADRRVRVVSGRRLGVPHGPDGSCRR